MLYFETSNDLVFHDFTRCCNIEVTCFFFPTVLHTGWNWLIVVQLKNGFVVAVRLSSDRSKTTSKYGTNKKVAHEAQVSV